MTGMTSAEDAVRPSTRTEQAISLAGAQKVAEAVVAAAERRGARLAVVVVDQRGAQVLVARMDGASDFALDNATAKARTAVWFRRETADLPGYLRERSALAAALSARPEIMASDGGAPLHRAEQVVGGVGASGASPTVDDECIAEGVAAFGRPTTREGTVLT